MDSKEQLDFKDWIKKLYEDVKSGKVDLERFTQIMDLLVTIGAECGVDIALEESKHEQ